MTVAKSRPASPGKPVKPAPAKAPAAKATGRAAAAKASPAGSTAASAGKPATRVGASAPGKATPAKAANAKTSGRKGRGDGGSEANLHKRVDSERIAEHIAAFEKSGGRVEKLGVTRVLQKITAAPATAPAQATKSGGRRR